MSIASPEPWEIELDTPNRNRSNGLTKSPAPIPTIEIDQMEGNAGVFTLNVLSTSDQATGFTLRGVNSGDELHIGVNSMGDYFTIESLADSNDITIEYKTDYADGTHKTVDVSYSIDGGET